MHNPIQRGRGLQYLTYNYIKSFVQIKHFNISCFAWEADIFVKVNNRLSWQRETTYVESVMLLVKLVIAE